MRTFTTNQGVIQLPLSECESVARDAYRRVCALIANTLQRAADLRIGVPAQFADAQEWHDAEAAIDRAVGQSEKEKVVNLCADYESRATVYCRSFLAKARRA